MNGYNVYKTFLGIKFHFLKKDFDYASYGSIKAKNETFLKRKDRYFFERIAKKYNQEELENLFISNFLEKNNLWVGDLLEQQAEEVYKKWCKRNQSLEYVFEQDIEYICRYIENKNISFNDIFKTQGEYPLILKMALRNEITPETYCMLDLILNFTKNTDKIINDITYENISLKYKKYKSFLKTKEIQKYKIKIVEVLKRNKVCA